MKKQVEDVEVDGDGSEDVLLGGDRELVVAPHHHLRKANLYKNLLLVFYLSVVDEVDGEYEDADGRVDEMKNLNVDSKQGKNGNAEAKQDKDKEDTGQNPSAESEVNFCLQDEHQVWFHPLQMTWKAKAVRKMTRRAVIPRAIITSSPSYSMHAWIKHINICIIV